MSEVLTINILTGNDRKVVVRERSCVDEMFLKVFGIVLSSMRYIHIISAVLNN